MTCNTVVLLSNRYRVEVAIHVYIKAGRWNSGRTIHRCIHIMCMRLLPAHMHTSSLHSHAMTNTNSIHRSSLLISPQRARVDVFSHHGGRDMVYCVRINRHFVRGHIMKNNQRKFKKKKNKHTHTHAYTHKIKYIHVSANYTIKAHCGKLYKYLGHDNINMV